MLDSLTNKINGVVSKLKGYGKLTEKNIEEALREVKIALLEADVHVKVVRELLNDLKEKAMGEEVKSEQFLSQNVHECRKGKEKSKW